ncbi:HalOD1 output domain-containing protein [Haladaptatus sp. AB643]|uniref:DUF7504 family protein n=1 Tax=Haladaptatus sp. AB643 TaxID=2934174 RepID=UPI00209BDB9A|nr:HalOD1 output domain-containing protein [Haladaptatus sp. AB643]MCO8245163.1 hypothetical protein [Haladaptatus sp. AB643]
MTTAGDSSFDAGSTLLSTAAMGREGDIDCVHRLSGDGARERNVLIVTYNRSPEVVLQQWQSRIGDEPTELGIIAIGGGNARTGTHRLEPHGDQNSVSLSNPASLGRLETTIRLYLDEWSANDHPTVLCFDSVSTLLRHVDRTTAFRFLATLTDQLRHLDVVAHFHIVPDAHDGSTVAMLRSLFDVVHGYEETEPAVSADVLLALLGSPRRRHVCRYLCEVSDSATVSGIARQIAMWEGSGVPSENEYERVHITLWHVHLPELAEVGVLQLDGNVVSSAIDRDVLERYVQLTTDDSSTELFPSLTDSERIRTNDPPEDEPDEAYWTVYGTAPDSIVVTLARALANVRDVPPTELQPILSDVIDIDALQRLAEHEDISVYATFQYEGYEVVVDSGEIKLYDSR